MKINAFCLFFFLFFFLPLTVSAQALSERWVCLKAERCDTYAECSGLTAVTDKVHKAWLTVDPTAKPLPNKETYIIECVATSNGQICTTGTAANDNIVFKNNNLATLSNTIDYSYIGLFKNDGITRESNPLLSKGMGELGPLIWGDSSPITYSRKWMALNYWTPVGGGGTEGAVGALQQGTVDFDFTTAEKDCVSIKWDPFGRVFDSNSLEPVFGASVTLLKKRDDGSYTNVISADVTGGNIINPQRVIEDGEFSFVVPDGTYKLIATNPGYSFPVSDLTKIHSNYSRIYSDVYPALTGEEIVQKGGIQHRDIPIEPVGTSVNNPPKMMEYFYEVRPVTQKIIIQGRVSHPFTNLVFYSIKPSTTNSSLAVRYRQLGEIKADKLGYFNFEIDQSKFESSESFGELELEKTNLQSLVKKNRLFDKFFGFISKFITEARAQTRTTTTLKFQPIPTYLEGYAYDSNNKVITNAKVGVYLTFSNKPYYETTADETGFFKISSENLPTMAYELRYTTSGGAPVKTTTSQFIAQNQQYLAENNVEIYVYKNQQGKEITEANILPTTPVLTGPKTITTQQTNNLLVLIGVLVFMLIAVIVILVVYLIKKKQTEMV